ncbi:hypothetical protein IJU97_02645 [bacterium]|nr:hypothetical protein [bacterium]
MMIHAGTKKVEIVTLDSYWKSHFKGIGSFKYLYKNYNKQIAQTNYLKISATPTSQTQKVDTITTIIEDTNNKNEEQHDVAPTTEEKSITLEDTKLDATGKAFFKEWNIEIK